MGHRNLRPSGLAVYLKLKGSAKHAAFSGTNIHIDGPGPSFFHNSCRGSTEVPLHLSCDREENITEKWRLRIQEEDQRGE